MRQLERYTEDQVVEIFETVVNRIAPKYACKNFELDDVKQEGFIICMKALEKYDESKPLENFLSVVLSRRFKNYLRDNQAFDRDSVKGRIRHPAQLENEHTILDNQRLSMSVDHLDLKEITELVNREIPANMRMDYLKMLNEVPIPDGRRAEIQEYIHYLLEVHKYKGEEDVEQLEDW